MSTVRKLAWLALGVACLHLVFGAIVRITGSGLGCGTTWPKCYGYWFPPFSRPDLIIEVLHRYLASIVTLSLVLLWIAAWRHRGEPGVGGRGGVLRMASAAVVTVFAVAVLGGVTVKLGNAPWTVVAHWTLAMMLLAMLAAAVVRAGAMGGTGVRGEHAPRGFVRSAYAAAGMAFLTVAMGGLTANFPFAAVGCTTFPFCGPNPDAPAGSVHIQLTHRTIAILLALHLIGMALRARGRVGPTVRRALNVATALVVLQIVIAASMVLLHLPPALRSLHEATGVGIWLASFTLAYLARIAAGLGPLGEGRAAAVPGPSPSAGGAARPLAEVGS
ncbi:MAG TPA: COX15/CtaA family protein [Gemmatimonadaceae bacterium]|nr:COX15/CtaA family protein [Gemmatimonadaceae bacterium]